MTKRLTIALVALAIFLLIVVCPVSATLTSGYYKVAYQINRGATVFIGEQGLDIRPITTTNVPATNVIGWWASAAQTGSTSPTVTIDLGGREANFQVTQSEFDGYEGNWYTVDPVTGFAAQPFFNVKAPKLDISIRDPNQNNGADVSGKSLPQGSQLQFQIGTNMQTVLSDGKRGPIFNDDNSTAGIPSDGYLDILVKTESGTVLQKLYTNASGDTEAKIISLNVSTQPYVWGRNNAGGFLFNWSTDAVNPATNQRAYPAGTYVVSVQSKLNNMKDNYLSGAAAYTGRTVSETKTMTLVSDTVSITANKDSVVRTKPFSVTVTGKPSEFYNLWVKSSANLIINDYDNEPPLVTKFQEKVFPGDARTADYQYQNGAGKTVSAVSFGCATAQEYSYATIQLSTSGTRTIEFSTTKNTKAQKYTVRVERQAADGFKGDEVDVKVEKGAVTIVAAGDQSYYLGEEIKFSGTNTESDKTYLFIIGPNLNENGAQTDSPKEAVTADRSGGDSLWDSDKVSVLADNTWSFKWGTAALDVDAGTYTIYAVSRPYDKRAELLAEAAYGTVSIIIKKPFVSATASQSTVAKGDKVFITGTAEGKPSGVAIWVLGKNFAARAVETVNSDATFKYELKQEVTKSLYSGQYFLVVQHPMQNDVFDIDVDSSLSNTDVYVVNKALNEQARQAGDKYISVFKIKGAGSLQGSDAAEALVQGINDPNVDDTYTKLQFLVEEPIITIDSIGDKHVGDKFTITAKTNLAVDDEVLVQVYSSSFKPTQKSQSGEFSGATGTIKVTKGDTGMNKLTFDVDSSTFKPDEYIVTVDAVIQSVTGTALFNVLEGAAPTATPTAAVTTAVQTAVVTTVPTTVPPTPTPTKSPGYGALIALIGLGAVAFIVVRRH